MPELRSSAWSAVQSFPAPDGSRTLRVNVPNEVIDALQSKALRGVRQSFLWQSAGGSRRLVTETEVLTLHGQWINQREWESIRGSGAGAGASAGGGYEDYRLPRLVIDHLKCGRIKAVKQILIADAGAASGIRAEISLEDGATGAVESLKNYMTRESASVEMCVPLSSDESTAFFSPDGQITGIRHSWVEGGVGHGVEIRPAHTNQWTPLTTNEVFVWNKIVLPHFRFIFVSPDRRKDNVNSPTPWVQ